MAEITAALVKELREKSGAGMMDCKKALKETSGNVEDAMDWLRKNGFAKASKKSDRAACEGLVGAAISADAKKACVVEVNAETDFVSRNETFQDFVRGVTQVALGVDGDVEDLLKANYPTGKTVADELTQNIATIGEHMDVRRSAFVSVDKGACVSYVHSALSEGLGKIGVIVALESDGDVAKLSDLGKKIAMHIAASRPEFLAVEDVDASTLERERAIFVDQAKASGKPDNIIEKMVEGRIRKFYEEIVLLEQSFIMDTDKKIKDVLADFAKESGQSVALKSFKSFILGEGTEKKVTDFAEEVAKTAGLK